MLREDIKEFMNSIDKNVTVVAATKYVGVEEMTELLNNGINNFGENRVEPFLEKYEKLKDTNAIWHFIGHLQRNKADAVINKIDYLHSLDSLKLAKLIDEKRTTPLKCFIEVSVNLEENKNGVPFKELNSFVEEVIKYKNIELVGLMMMAVKASDHQDLSRQFKALAYLKERINKEYNLNLKYLSMGMSDDYKEAIEAGSTHVRLGRVLWTQ